MLVYQGCKECYNNVCAPHTKVISKQRLKRATSKRQSLSRKNSTFLKSLGFEVKVKGKGEKKK